MRTKRIRLDKVIALALLCACTASPAPSPVSPSSGSPTPSSSVQVGGNPLPANCDPQEPSATQTVAFASLGQVWALDPSSGALSCLLDESQPGSFLWGPQGDRVLLDGFQVAGWGSAPSFAATGLQPSAVGWSRPHGTALIFADKGATRPQMFLLESGNTITLDSLPAATYLDFSYHPTGLAIGYILESRGTQAIWFSMNTGKKAKQLVFTEEGTTFSDLNFSRDGLFMYYVAHHTAGYSELHKIDLRLPKTLVSLWKGPKGEYVRTFSPSPNDKRFAVTEGAHCKQSKAALLSNVGSSKGPYTARTLIPDATGPTTTLGWLDLGTILVSQGGCGAPLDLFAVQANGNRAPKLLATGVDVGATRTPRPSWPSSLPIEVRLASGPGVG